MTNKLVHTLVFKNANGDIVRTHKLNKNCVNIPYSCTLEDTEECGYIVFRDERPEFYNQILMKIKTPNKEWAFADVVVND